ncbi:unnamed protein product [Timema podura]|uniref:NADH dehydrogenase subunit 5 n=1 Tax=Timema podura TaxID=61482 RepID=A0ABN7P426_TIMPD|nr:unnamed protein product [Timema podura]
MYQWLKTGSVRKQKLTETPTEILCTSFDTDWINNTTPQQVQEPVPGQTTGLTGLVVSKHPHHTLGILYNKILRSLQKMPSDAAYRKYTEKIISERARIVETTSTVSEIENNIGCGQVEELIVQAENELVLARKMLGWKPWEPLVQDAAPHQWAWPPAK